MIKHILFIRKIRNSNAVWAYVYNKTPGTFTSINGPIPFQMGIVIEHLLQKFELEDEELVVVSPHVNHSTFEDLNTLFPDVFFMPVFDSSVFQFFNKAILASDSPNLPKKPKKDVLHVGCDASGGHKNHPQDKSVSAAWAWASDGLHGRYAVGESGTVNVNIAEYQALLNGALAHAEHPANTIHMYSDSSIAVDMFNYDLSEGTVPREARKHGLVSLTNEVIDLMQERRFIIEWVKGHRSHRLNQVADSLSRLARIRYNSGLSYPDFKTEADAIYRTFNLAI